MADDRQLAAVLSEFARTLVTDVPIQGLLDHLVIRVTELMPVSSAGVTLISAGVRPRYVAASNDAAYRYEKIQEDVGEGPCLEAFTTGEAVCVADLTADDQFPRFAALAVPAGLAAVFTFPLRQDAIRLGALDLYRETPGGLDPDDVEAAQTLADVAAAHLTNVQARADAHAVTDHFRHGALHDSLTGLPNRALLAQRMAHASQRGRRSQAQAAVFFVDLDRFKLVNDRFGHRVGDELLVAVARRLTLLLRPGDTLARVSGDEFVIVCEDLKDGTQVESLAHRITSAFKAPFQLPGAKIALTASVGIVFTGPGQDLAGLLDTADEVMYQVKRGGGAGHQIVDLRTTNRVHEWVQLTDDLAEAMAEDRLRLYYQPVVRTVDGAMKGVEALLRWRHHTFGDIDPAKIVAMAEKAGIVQELNRWVLRRACLDQRLWRAEGPVGHDLSVAVNVSPSQLLSPEFERMVDEVLDECDADPTHLIVEITEDSFLSDGADTWTAMRSLQQRGIKLAIDDFGTGYSALGYLQKYPVDIVKIDKAFLRNMDGDERSALFFTAVVNLARVLDIDVTAEGIETPQQALQALRSECEYGQGFHYSEALPADGIAALVRAGGVACRLPVAGAPTVLTAAW